MGKIIFECNIDEEIASADNLQERLRTIFPSISGVLVISAPDTWGPLDWHTSEVTDASDGAQPVAVHQQVDVVVFERETEDPDNDNPPTPEEISLDIALIQPEHTSE